MKLKKIFGIALCACLGFSVYAEDSISNVIKNFDSALMRANSPNAKVTIGFITYAETESCGTVVPWFQNEIKSAASDSRRIEIIKTTELSETEQTTVATRGLKVVNTSAAKQASSKKYVIGGKYYEEGNNISLKLEMRDSDGSLFSSGTAVYSKSEILGKNLTLYPKNSESAKEIQKDFVNSDNGKTTKKSSVINIAASMLDANGEMVNILHPKDVVKFKVCVDQDCYLSILLIDANNEKQWLPMKDNYMEKGEIRYFPDLPGKALTVNDDGVLGAEQVIIYAASDKSALPPQVDEGRYNNNDLQMIMRKQKLSKQNNSVSSGNFKITYTIINR